MVLHQTRALLGFDRPADTVVTHAPDASFHELEKFLRLALKANPSVLAPLWLQRRRSALRDDRRRRRRKPWWSRTARSGPENGPLPPTRVTPPRSRPAPSHPPRHRKPGWSQTARSGPKTGRLPPTRVTPARIRPAPAPPGSAPPRPAPSPTLKARVVTNRPARPRKRTILANPCRPDAGPG
ncbi:nucleotidyltransferase domain-containing protein [Microbacteriaceae bacterium VKM Ac-2855]|nr:nucleotidyltransferase domain-containing protein [Microbacteriaceae bacterium VKM Ac-2855]